MTRINVAILTCLLASCVHQADDEGDPAPSAHTSLSADQRNDRGSSPAVRAQRDGRAFPDGVLALTWDDGPDVHTRALAEYLQHEHISATFFVVGEWVKGVSSDPGFGTHVYESGHAKMPLLAEVVALGHRIGNHTLHHTLLGRANPQAVDRELGDNQRGIDPYVHDELRLFRVPGGDWNGSASRAVDGDAYLSQLVGPIRWDVDAKDWYGSVWCDSSHPSRECEHAGGRYRVRPDVMAQRYEAAIESAGRGIVLMHDRVGDVGSDYALEMAHLLVPRLVARGYVFAAPVLAFSQSRTRWSVATCDGLRLGDVDGDGRADACVRDHDRVTCGTSVSHRDDTGLEHVAFDSAHDELLLPSRARAPFELADVSGDGRADVCVRTATGIECAIATATGFGSFERWTRDSFDDARFADIDGDGRADVCGITAAGIACARSTGTVFEPAHAWFASPTRISAIVLGDVNGDGRADVCIAQSGGVDCALSTKASFARASRWSTEAPSGSIELGDLNGDGRADLCVRTKDGVSCALSRGHAFTKTTSWLDGAGPATAEWGHTHDINGDGRADFCDCDGGSIRCGLAP